MSDHNAVQIKLGMYTSDEPLEKNGIVKHSFFEKVEEMFESKNNLVPTTCMSEQNLEVKCLMCLLCSQITNPHY